MKITPLFFKYKFKCILSIKPISPKWKTAFPLRWFSSLSHLKNSVYASSVLSFLISYKNFMWSNLSCKNSIYLLVLSVGFFFKIHNITSLYSYSFNCLMELKKVASNEGLVSSLAKMFFTQSKSLLLGIINI